MTQSTRIGSGHVDLTLQGLPELLRGVREAASSLRELTPPPSIDDAEVRKLLRYVSDTKELAKIQAQLAAGRKSFGTTGAVGAAFRDRAAIENIKEYTSQSEKALAIDKQRQRHLAQLQATIDRQMSSRNAGKMNVENKPVSPFQLVSEVASLVKGQADGAGLAMSTILSITASSFCGLRALWARTRLACSMPLLFTPMSE